MDQCRGIQGEATPCTLEVDNLEYTRSSTIALRLHYCLRTFKHYPQQQEPFVIVKNMIYGKNVFHCAFSILSFPRSENDVTLDALIQKPSYLWVCSMISLREWFIVRANTEDDARRCEGDTALPSSRNLHDKIDNRNLSQAIPDCIKRLFCVKMKWRIDDVCMYNGHYVEGHKNHLLAATVAFV